MRAARPARQTLLLVVIGVALTAWGGIVAFFHMLGPIY